MLQKHFMLHFISVTSPLSLKSIIPRLYTQFLVVLMQQYFLCLELTFVCIQVYDIENDIMCPEPLIILDCLYQITFYQNSGVGKDI